MSLVTFPRQFLVDMNGTPRVGAKATFYAAGTSTLITVYTTGDYDVPHSNPVESVAGGLFPAVYVNPSVNSTYKLLITDSADVPIPGYPEDNIPALGATLYLRTTAEIAAGVTPTAVQYFPPIGVDVRRFGVVGDGSADDSAAMAVAISTGQPLDLGSLTIRIVTQLTFNQANQRIYARGGGFKFDGAASQRLANVSAVGVEFYGVDFDGNAKQVKGALVYIETNAARPKFVKCRFRRVTGVHTGGTATTDSNNQYGLLISFYGVAGFEVDGCLFDDISNDNSGANGVTPTVGRGFCGGVCFLTDDFVLPTTPQTIPTSGRIHGCLFNDIVTVMAGGLSVADQLEFNDADGIRFFGERDTALIKLPVVVSDCVFYDCGKRAIKNSEAAGTTVRNITVIATSALAYPMACAVKVDGDNQIVDGVNIYATSGAPVRFAMQSHNCTYLRVSNVTVNFCDQLWDLAPTSTSYSSRGWRVSNVQGSSCTFYGIRNSTNCLNYIDVVFEGVEAVAASGVHDFTGFRVGAATDRVEVTLQDSRIVNGDVKVNGYGWTFRNIYQEIDDASYTGSSSTIAALESGITPQTTVTRDSKIENYELNFKAIPDAYLTVQRPYLFLIYGDRVKVKNLKVFTPDTLDTTRSHGAFGGGDDLQIVDFEYSGEGYITLGAVFAGPHRRMSIHGARRVGGTAADQEFLNVDNGQDCEIVDVFDGRAASGGTINIAGGTVSGSRTWAYIIDGVRSFATAAVIVDAGGLAFKSNITSFDNRNMNTMVGLADGITAPATATGIAHNYVDTADGDQKTKFADGFVAVVGADS